MKTRVQELVGQGSQLFSKKKRVDQLHQEIAEQFYPERADFTTTLEAGDEFASHLMTGAPSLYRRDLADQLSAMLRPRGKPWFRARTHNDKINNDAGARAFLDELSDRMQRIMYERRGNFVRSTKQGDHDFATFGQNVICVDPNKDATGVLYRTRHLRDVAWCESSELAIDGVHENWKQPAINLKAMFKGKVHQSVLNACDKDPYTEIKCRRIVIPADQYDYQDKTKAPKREFPFVSIHVDVENDFLLEEKPQRRLGYNISRWATVSGSQYAHSPAMVVALPDARLLQQITLTLLEAGQKAVDPPAVAVAEAISGGVQLFAGGVTAIDPDYDERMGEALRYLNVDTRGFNWAGDREKLIMELIRKALFLDQIDIPYPEGEKWTATEYRGRVEQYIMRALPLFEPMEVEYNGGLLEESFEQMQDMRLFGDLFSAMPQALKGQEIRWSFESPLQQATERVKSQSFLQTAELLKIAAELDKRTIHDVDIRKGMRDAIQGTGAPADWVVPIDKADAAAAQATKSDAAEAELEQMGKVAQLAQQGGAAASSMGLGAESLRNAGLV
jgi:hypothetical protein